MNFWFKSNAFSNICLSGNHFSVFSGGSSRLAQIQLRTKNVERTVTITTATDLVVTIFRYTGKRVRRKPSVLSMSLSLALAFCGSFSKGTTAPTEEELELDEFSFSSSMSFLQAQPCRQQQQELRYFSLIRSAAGVKVRTNI